MLVKHYKKTIKNLVKKLNDSYENHKKFFKSCIAIVSFILVAVPVITDICNYYNENAMNQASFSFELSSDNPHELTKQLVICNVGGDISNAQVKPYMQLDLETVQNKEYFRRHKIEFTDFYASNLYSYDYSEKCFKIDENNIERLYLYMQNLDNDLKNFNSKITTYSIQQYFDISYNDYKGKTRHILLETSNNHNHYFVFDELKFERNFNNYELIKIKSVPKSEISMPIFNDKKMISDMLKKDYKIRKITAQGAEPITSITTDGFLESEKYIGIGIREKKK